jgi:hypothetical protein
MDTQVGRLFDPLHLTSIAARAPQAKGRIERVWGTFQDRLVSELRLGCLHQGTGQCRLAGGCATFQCSFPRSALWRWTPLSRRMLSVCSSCPPSIGDAWRAPTLRSTNMLTGSSLCSSRANPCLAAWLPRLRPLPRLSLSRRDLVPKGTSPELAIRGAIALGPCLLKRTERMTFSLNLDRWAISYLLNSLTWISSAERFQASMLRKTRPVVPSAGFCMPGEVILDGFSSPRKDTRNLVT